MFFTRRRHSFYQPGVRPPPGRKTRAFCRSKYRKRIKQAVKSEEPREYEDQILLINGDGWSLSIFSLIQDSGGAVTGVQVVGHDISGCKRTELALRESEERFRALIENLAAAVVVNDLEDRF